MGDDNASAGAATARLPALPPLHRGQSLFLDFDGTLVDIAATPDLIRVSPDLGSLLCAVASLLDGAVAIISGRPADALARRLAPFAGTVIGQHGCERRNGDGRLHRAPADPALEPIRTALTRFAARHEGVFLEDKGGTLALHYRGAPALAQACRAQARRAADASGGAFAAIDGKMVMDIVPRQGGKGRAIAALLDVSPFRGKVPVFVGDDTADEDGFAVVDRRGGVSVHVGDRATVARHRLGSVADVLAWLALSAAGCARSRLR